LVKLNEELSELFEVENQLKFLTIAFSHQSALATVAKTSSNQINFISFLFAEQQLTENFYLAPREFIRCKPFDDWKLSKLEKFVEIIKLSNRLEKHTHG
jgi:hypothetical protein